jgi:hypothetical protein
MICGETRTCWELICDIDRTVMITYSSRAQVSTALIMLLTAQGRLRR